MHRPTLPWLFWALSSSLVLHGVAYASLGLSPRSVRDRPGPSEVTFEVNPLPEPPPPAAAAEPEKPEPQAALPAPPRMAPPAAPATPKAAAASELPPAAPAPLDLSGVTLTNADDSSFSMQVGNGRAFSGPIGPGSGRGASLPAPPTPSGLVAARGPEIVPLSDLSSRPVPPALDGALRQNYPEEARRRAIGGSASVRARLDPDGILRRVQIQSETFPGFGSACRRTLEGSRWSAPRDRGGRAVATEIRYTCRFQVEP